MAGMIDAATHFPGHLGGQLVRPGEAGSGDEPLLYHVVFAFDNDAHLAAWQDSPERSHWLAQVAPHTVGAQEMRRVSGLDYWFAPAGSTTKAPQAAALEGGGRDLAGHLPDRAAAVPHRGAAAGRLAAGAAHHGHHRAGGGPHDLGGGAAPDPLAGRLAARARP